MWEGLKYLLRQRQGQALLQLLATALVALSLYVNRILSSWTCCNLCLLGVLLARRRAQNAIYADFGKQTLRNKTLLMTGVSSGIGHAALIHLAALQPARIIFGVRSRGDVPAKDRAKKIIDEAKQMLASSSISFDDIIFDAHELDLGRFSSVNSFCREVKKSVDRIDVLCLNAGVASTTDLSLTADGFERTVQLNVLSHQLLLEQFTPLLKKAPFPRIIFTASTMAFFVDYELPFNRYHSSPAGAFEANKRYQESKLMNLLQIQLYWKKEGIFTAAFCPGFAKTSIGRTNGILGRSLQTICYELFGTSAARGCQTMVMLAVAEKLTPAAFFSDLKRIPFPREAENPQNLSKFEGWLRESLPQP